MRPLVFALASTALLAAGARLAANRPPPSAPASASGSTAALTIKPGDGPFTALALPYGVGPRISDRPAWAALPLDRAQILAAAEAELARPEPVWTEADYLAYFTTGSREPHGKPFRDRLHRAGLFTLAAGLADDPRFTAAAVATLAAILDEPTWVIPAHDSKTQDNFYGRVTDIDLGVVMRAWTLATAGWILDEKLEPAFRDRLKSELHRRAVAPYLRRLDGDTSLCKWVWWQGNWNAVCHAGILGTALYVSPSKAEIERIVAGLQATIEKSFHGHADDGYCSEGIMYHNYGFGHYANLAEMLHRASHGAVDLFANPRIRAIAAFPTRFEVFDQRFPSFADTPYGSRAQRGLQSLLAYRLNDPALLPPALRVSEKPYGFGAGSLVYDTLLIVTSPPPPPLTQAEWSPRHEFTSGGVLIVRPLAPGDTTLGAAFKGGHNAELHNHNDVGTYAIAVGDSFPVTDVGSEVYTKDTFNANRYTRPINNSYGHNVPVIDGRLQVEGRQAAARVVRRDFTPEADTWVLDLSACYDSPKLASLEREFRYFRDAVDPRIEITDRVAFKEPATYANAFMTLGAWEQRDERTLAFTHGRNTLVATLASDAHFTVSEDKLEGQNLPNKLRATRVGIDFPEPATAFEFKVVFRPERPAAASTAAASASTAAAR